MARLSDQHGAPAVADNTFASPRASSRRKQRRLGITDSLLRLSAGIEAVDDLKKDLAQAFGVI